MRVSLIKNGIVENIIEADSVERAESAFPGYLCVEGGEGIGWEYDGQVFSPPLAIPAQVKSWGSGFEFLREFTVSEQAGIRAAAKLSAEIETFLRMAELAPGVRADDPLLIAGMGAVVSAGLLSAERRAEILY